MERGLQHRWFMRYLKTSSSNQWDVQRDRNAETWHVVTTMRAALSHVTATCGVLARANCNHGFSISQPQGDRDSANCLALPFEFPLVVDYERFVDKVSASRVSVCRSENRTRLYENETIFSRLSSPRQKNSLVRIGRGASHCEVNYIYRSKARSFRRYRRCP